MLNPAGISVLSAMNAIRCGDKCSAVIPPTASSAQRMRMPEERHWQLVKKSMTEKQNILLEMSLLASLPRVFCDTYKKWRNRAEIKPDRQNEWTG